ncbi:MAG: YihY/virulence factor BrkB family protein [Planctomycetota bacterium]
MKKWLEPIFAATRRLFTSPLGELNRWQRTARYAVGVARYGAHELKEDRAAQMAAALTYRTIFSLIPLFVLSLLVFNAFGGFAGVGSNLRETIYDYLGLDVIAIESAEDRAAGQAGGEVSAETVETTPPTEAERAADPDQTIDGEPPAENRAETRARVDELLTELQEQVASVDFTSIGLVGLGLLIWAGLSLVVSLENCLNRVVHAPSGRPWHLRISIYWATITLGPVLIALSFYVTNRLLEVGRSLDTFGLTSWFINVPTFFASLATTWLLLVLIYTLLPNAKVQVKAALIGALVAAVLWEASKWGFRLYVRRAVGYSALYGSLGLVPLFLLWLYVTWLVILFGLEITYVAQTVRSTKYLRSRGAARDAEGLVDLRSVLAVAARLGRAFDRGDAVAAGELASDTALPPEAIGRMLSAMTEAEIVHEVGGGDDGPGGFMLSRPAEQIAAIRLVEVTRNAAAAAESSTRPGDVWRSLDEAEAGVLEGLTLRDLVRQIAGAEGSVDRDDEEEAGGVFADAEGTGLPAGRVEPAG